MSFDPRVSVRARLALFNILVLVVIITTFSIGLRFTVGKVLQDTLDRQLTDIVDPLVRRHEGLPPLPPPQEDDRRPPPHEEQNGPPLEGGPEVGPDGPEEPGEPVGPPVNQPRPPRLRLPPGIYAPHHYPMDQSVTAYSSTALKAVTPTSERFHNDVYKGVPVRVYTVPLLHDGKVEEILQVAGSLVPTNRAMAGVTTATLYLIPLVLLLAGAGAIALTNSALKPVRDLTNAASHIEAANLSDRLPMQGQDEFAQLAAILNQMLSRIEAAFARQKRFTADASHELRTPLAVVKAHTSMLLDDETATVDELKDGLRAIDQASDRAQRIVQDLLLLARGESGSLAVHWSRVLLNDVLSVAVQSVQATRTAPMAPIRASMPPNTQIFSDKDHLTRLLINLLDNAVRHTPATGQVTVIVSTDNRQITITVADTGEGIPAEHLARITEPFYRVDAARARKSGGAGLGLAICRTIVDAFSGTMRFESAPGKGTMVTVTLPLSPNTVARGE
jgi:signal transduction histidine kinase